MEKRLTCIICPMSCSLVVKSTDGKNLEITGNACPRGKTYAENECTFPTRILTTTVRDSKGGLVAVKTEKPIPKESILACMALLSSLVIKLPVSVGDTVLEDAFGSRIIATQNRK